jgi:hypothetical protein
MGLELRGFDAREEVCAVCVVALFGGFVSTADGLKVGDRHR